MLWLSNPGHESIIEGITPTSTWGFVRIRQNNVGNGPTRHWDSARTGLSVNDQPCPLLHLSFSDRSVSLAVCEGFEMVCSFKSKIYWTSGKGEWPCMVLTSPTDHGDCLTLWGIHLWMANAALGPSVLARPGGPQTAVYSMHWQVFALWIKL